jgi:hypothetical protein
MFEINQLTSQDISIFIVIIGALFLYFGGIVGETKVEKYDKFGYYRNGLFFSLVYIYFPFLLAYIIYIKNLFTISPLVSVFVQVVIFFCLTFTIMAYESKRYELLDFVKKKAEQELVQLKEQNLLNVNISRSLDYGMNAIYEIPIKLFGNKITLFIFSFLTILSNLCLYKLEGLLFLMSVVFAFLILTMVALAYGFGDAYYPPGKIYMVDGSVIEGKILKFGEYVCVLKDDKKIFINSDKINYVEESKFKEKKIE